MSDEDMTDLHTETLSCTQQIFVQGKKDPAKMTHTIMALIKHVLVVKCIFTIPQLYSSTLYGPSYFPTCTQHE